MALPGDQKLINKASGPFSGGYRPDLDDSPELGPIRSNFYQLQIGILFWCVELGCIEIITELSILSTYLLCRMKVTWKLSSMCLHTLRCITMRGLCLTRIALGHGVH
jgi:hypothetical protein